jgi:phosphocarrier protein HPr
MSEITRILQVINKKGIHARAAAKFVKTVSAHNATVSVTKVKSSTHHTADASQYAKVTGSSILGLMMLAAECGSSIEVSAMGEDAQKVMDELEALLKDKFGEGE